MVWVERGLRSEAPTRQGGYIEGARVGMTLPRYAQTRPAPTKSPNTRFYSPCAGSGAHRSWTAVIELSGDYPSTEPATAEPAKPIR